MGPISAAADLFVRIGADTKELQTAMEGVSTQMQNVGSRMTSVGKSMTTMVTGPIVAVGAGLTALAKTTADYGDHLDKASQRLGVSTDALQEMEFWASQNGMSAGELERAVGRLNQRVGQAAEGNDKYGAAFANLGVEIRDASGNIRDTESVMQDTIAALRGIEDPALQSAAAAEVFGTRMGRQLMPALSDTSMSLAEATARAHELGLVMDSDAVAGSAKFTDALDELQRSFTALGREVGAELIPIFVDTLIPVIQDTVIPMLRSVAETVAGAIKWFADLPEPVQKAALAATALVAAIGPVLIVVGKVVSAIGTISPAIAPVLAAVKGLGLAVAGVFTAVGAPVILAAAAVTALALVIYTFREEIMAALGGAFEWAANAAKTFVETFTGAFSGLVERTVGFFTGLADGVRDAISGMVDRASGIVQGIGEAFGRLSTMLGDVLSTAGSVAQAGIDKVVAPFRALQEMLSEPLAAAREAVAGIVDGLGQALTGGVGAATAAARTALSALTVAFDAIVQPIGRALSSVQQAVVTARDTVVDAFAGLRERTLGSVVDMFGAVREQLTSFVQTVRGAVESAVDFLGGLVSGFRERFAAVSQVVTAGVEAVLEPFRRIGDELQGLMAGVKDRITDALAAAFAWASNAAASFVEAFTGAFAGLVSTTVGAFTGLAEGVQGAIGGMVARASGVVQGVGDALNGLSDVVSRVLGLAASAVEYGIDKIAAPFRALQGLLGEPLTAARDTAASIIDGLQQALTGGFEAAGATARAALQSLAAAFESVVQPIGQALRAVQGATETARDAVVQAFGDLRERTVGVVLDMFEGVQARLGAFAQTVREAVDTAVGFMDGIATGFRDHLQAAAQVVQAGVETLLRPFDWLDAQFQGLMDGARDAIVGTLTAAFDRVSHAAASFVDAFSGAFAGLVDRTVGVFAGLAEGVQAAIGGMAERVSGVVQGVGDALSGLAHVVSEVLSTAATVVQAGIENVAAPFRLLQGLLAEPLAAARDTAAGIIDGVQQALTDGVETASTAVHSALGTLSTAFGAIVQPIDRALSSVRQAVETARDAVANAFSQLRERTLGVVLAMFDAVQARLDAFVQTVRGAVNTAVDFLGGLADGFQETLDGVKDAVEAGVQAILKPFDWLTGQLKGLMEGAKGALDFLNPFSRHSPSLVENVLAGTAIIKDAYEDAAKGAGASIKEMAQAKTEFERAWESKVFQATASRLDILEREKQEALAKAREMGAGTTDIVSYYEAQKEARVQEGANARMRFEEHWADRLRQETSTRLGILEAEYRDALAQAETLGADTAAVRAYYEQQITAYQASEVNERRKLAQEAARVEQQWADKVFQATASRLQILEQEQRDAVAHARELGISTANVVAHYERQKAQHIQEGVDARNRFEQQWNDRLFQHTATRAQILEREYQQALAQATKLGADTAAIRTLYEQQITDAQKKESGKRIDIAKQEADAKRSVQEPVSTTREPPRFQQPDILRVAAGMEMPDVSRVMSGFGTSRAGGWRTAPQATVPDEIAALPATGTTEQRGMVINNTNNFHATDMTEQQMVRQIDKLLRQLESQYGRRL